MVSTSRLAQSVLNAAPWRGGAVALLLLCSVLAGCRKGGPSGGERPLPGGRPKVALVMKSLANESFKTMEEGARAHQAKHAGEYDLVVNGIKDEQDVAKQIDLVAQMLALGVNALVIAPADSKALISSVKRAIDAGVVVVNIDTRLDPAVLDQKGLKIPFVGPNNQKGANLAGLYLARRLEPGDAVAIIEGLPTAESAARRRAGFEQSMKGAGMKIVASRVANGEMSKANQVMAALISEHPALKAVLCASDSMAVGAAAALKAAGKIGAVKMIGFDNISAVRELIRQKQVLATVDQHADQLAVHGIEYALETLKTKAPPVDRETPVDLVTVETLK